MTQIFREDPYLPPAPLWPKIIGWILLLWGLLGIGLSILGFANGTLDVKTYQGLPDWMIAQVRVGQIAGILAALLGLLAGLFLLLKARRGLSMARWWVAISLVLNAGGIAIQFACKDELQALMERSMLEAMEKQNQPTVNISPEMLKGIWYTQVGCAGLMGILFPGVIGFFVIGNKRRQEIASWSQ